MSKAITREQARDLFLKQVHGVVAWWQKESRGTPEERIDGVAFSIMNIIDGTSGMHPSMDLVVRPHPDAKAYRIENGEDYYVDGTVVNEDVMLHEFWRKTGGDNAT